MRGYLLDTHAWLWARTDSPELGPLTRALLGNPSHRLYLSSISTLEATIKWRLGKLRLPGRPADLVRESLQENQLEALPVTHEHAWRIGDLPSHHHDPFDRVLVAQALVENLELVTADALLRSYPAPIHWAST